jgi:hypothetical protein
MLQVSRAAQPLIITKAYRLLAALYHPDNKETGDREAFHSVVAAYRVLCDPVRRAAYDRDTFGTSSPLPSNGGPPEQELSERRAADERDLRRLLLQALYNVRRTEPHRPSLPLMVIPDLFGCSIDEAAGRYCERPPFRPRRRLKVSRSIAKPPPTSPTASTSPTAMTQNRGRCAIRRRSLLFRRHQPEGCPVREEAS